MPFALPESYRAYCTDTAVRTAVDHLLSSEDKKGGLSLPADIDWNDLPTFHRAVLSAYQVRCERAVFLCDLWDAIWKPAFAESGFRSDLDPWIVADTEEWNGANLDTKTVWTNCWFGRNFHIGGARYFIAPGVSDDAKQVRLSFALYDRDNTDHTTGRSFGDNWPEQDSEDGCAWTAKSLAPIPEDGMIDLASLRKAAAAALATVKTVLLE